MHCRDRRRTASGQPLSKASWRSAAHQAALGKRLPHPCALRLGPSPARPSQLHHPATFNPSGCPEPSCRVPCHSRPRCAIIPGMRTWRNGRRAGFRFQYLWCESSSLSVRTILRSLQELRLGKPIQLQYRELRLGKPIQLQYRELRLGKPIPPQHSEPSDRISA